VADKYWANAGSASDGDNDWSGANWADAIGDIGTGGAAKPGAGDDVHFTTDDSNCTLSEATAAINSLVVTSDYGGTLDFNDWAVNVTGGGDMTFDGSGTVDCGASTITCAGNFDNKHQGTWTRGTSTLVMTGTGKTLNNGGTYHNLTLSGSITLANAIRVDVYGVWTISGPCTQQVTSLFLGSALNISASIDVQAFKVLEVRAGTLTLSGGGTLTGDGELRVRDATVAAFSGAETWDIATSTIHRSNTLGAGVYQSSTVLCEGDNTGNTLTFGGACTFTGNVTFDADVAAYAVNVNNQNLTFQGNLTLSESVGTLTWTKGAGTITHSGTSDTTFTSAIADVMEDWVLDKGNDTAKLTLASDVYTDSFTGTQGRFDLDGHTLYSDGNVDCETTGGFQFHNGADNDMDGGCFDLDGGTLTLTGLGGETPDELIIDNLDFNLADGVTGSADWCVVTDSEVTYGTGGKIDATSANNTDGGGNTGWDFGGAVHELAGEDATHAHAADTPAITQVHVLAGEDAAHAQAAETPILTQLHKMIAAACAHAHAADSPVLSSDAETGTPLLWRLPPRPAAIDLPARAAVCRLPPRPAVVVLPAEDR